MATNEGRARGIDQGLMVVALLAGPANVIMQLARPGVDYLYPIAAGRVRGVALPRRLQRMSVSFALLITAGFLPQRFRDQMRLPWDAPRQRRFDRVMALLRTVNRLLPRFIRQFPFNPAVGCRPPNQDGASVGSRMI
jgi:uncharacterized protein (DUF2236 family)